MDSDRSARRQFLRYAGITAAALAGCAGTPGDGGTSTGNGSTSDVDTTSPTSNDRQSSESTADDDSESQSTNQNEYAWFHERGEILDDFSSFESDWEVRQGAASVKKQGFLAGPSVELASAGSSRVRIGRSFPDTRDLSGKDYSLAVNLRSTDREMVRVDVVLVDDAGAIRSYSNAILPSANDEWIHFDMAVDRDEDGFDPSTVSELWVEHYAGDGESTLWVDDLRTLPKPDTGAVLLTFDDAGPGDYGFAFPMFEEYGFKGVCFPQSVAVSESSEPTIAQYKEMKEAGWDIGGHTTEHQRLSEHSKEEQREILETNVEQLESKGLLGEDDIYHFRTPYGAYDTATLEVVLEYFDNCIAGAGTASGTSYHLTDPRMISFRSGEELDRTKELLDDAAEHRQLLGLTLHTKYIDEAYLEKVVEYVDKHVQQGNLRVMTMTEFYEDSLQ